MIIKYFRVPVLLLIVLTLLLTACASVPAIVEEEEPESTGSMDSEITAKETSSSEPERSDFEKLAEELGIPLGDLPWHLADTWWIIENMPADFQRLEIDVTIEGDLSSDYFLYISPINTSINDRLLYAGIQTHISGWVSKTDQTRITLDTGGIFSRWGKDMTEIIGLDYVDMFEDGLCESAGYEGTFCSTRRPYGWSAGTYTFSLIKEETIIYNDVPHTWVAYEITDQATLITTRIGRLLFEGESLVLRDSFCAFVEVYGVNKNVPEVTVTFGFPRVDDVELSFTQIYVARPAKAPNCSTFSLENEEVIVRVRPNELRPHTQGSDAEFTFLR